MLEPNTLLGLAAVAALAAAVGFTVAVIVNRRRDSMISAMLNLLTDRLNFLTGQVDVLKTNYQILYREIDTMRRQTIPDLDSELSRCRAELDATRIDRDAVTRDYQSRLAEAFTDTGTVVMELEATREMLNNVHADPRLLAQ